MLRRGVAYDSISCSVDAFAGEPFLAGSGRVTTG